MHMQKLKMNVYQMNHDDGTPRKYWCYHLENSTLTTRWGGAGKRLQESSKIMPASKIWKLVNEKESKRYKDVGVYEVDADIHWSGNSSSIPAQTPVPAQTPAPVAAKFNDNLIHWTASDLPGDWQTVVIEALDTLLSKRFTIDLKTASKLTIGFDDVTLDVVVRNSRARGTIEKSKSAWLFAACLLKLARHLQITIVDDKSDLVDRKSLYSQIDTLCVTADELDDVMGKLGLIVNHLAIKDNPILMDFF